MTAYELNRMYGAIISPTASVSVPEHWMPAIHDALAAFRDLPTDVRALMIVLGIVQSGGHLVMEIGAVPDLISESGKKQIAEIVQTAQAVVQRSVH